MYAYREMFKSIFMLLGSGCILCYFVMGGFGIKFALY